MSVSDETPRVRAFLAAIREYPDITRAAAAAGISRFTHYRRYERDEAYRKAFDFAWICGIGLVRDVAIRRVIDGIEEPVIYKGKYQYAGKGKNKRLVTVRKYPERLHMKVLGAELPDVYNRGRIEHTGPGGGPIQTKVEILFVHPPEPEGSK